MGPGTALQRIALLVAAAAPLLALVIPISAQQRPPTYRAGVEAVVLDVSVLDRDGQPVHGLTSADFTVLEDGRPQKIDTFTAIDLPDVVRTGATWIRDTPRETRANTELNEGAIVVIVLDDTMMPRAAGQQVPSYARRVVDGLGPNDLAAVVYIVSKRSGQTFTHDRSRLLAAVERYKGGAASPGSLGTAISELAPRMLVDTLGDLADGLSALPARRKAIVFISVGLDLDLSRVMPDTPRTADAPAAHHVGTIIGDLLRLFDRARSANVSVYGVDPAGLDPEFSKARLDFLKTLSSNTGGFTVTDTNDPQPGITQIFRENASYYVVGYQPANARTEGRFRRIEVQVNRPGVTVRTRSGYSEPGRAAASGAAATKAPNSLVGAMSGFFPRTDVPMHVTAAPFALAGGRQAAVAIVLGLQPTTADMAAGAATSAGQEDVDVLISAYDQMGSLRSSDRLHARVRLRPDASDRPAFEVLSRLDLRPGRYQLRLAATVRGKTGSVYHDVEVPDFAALPLSLSGVALTADPAVPSAPKDRLRPVVPIVPTARRDFARSDRATAFLRVYQGGNGALAPVAIRTRILDASGAEVFQSARTLDAAAFGTARAADLSFDVPVAGLQPGPHLFTLEATMGARLERRDVTFVVH